MGSTNNSQRNIGRAVARITSAGRRGIAACGMAVALAWMGDATPMQGADSSAQPATIRGLMVDEQGQPIAGAELLLHGWVYDTGREAAYGRVINWTDHQAASGDDGLFGIRFHPLPPLAFSLKATAPGFADRRWFWEHIDPGAYEDLSWIVMKAGGSVVARVLDSEGVPMTSGFFATVKNEASGRFPHKATPDRSTGELLFTGVNVGRKDIKLYFETYGWLDGPSIDVDAGQVLRVDCPYPGPDLTRRIKLDVRTRTGVRPQAEFVRLIGPDGSVQSPTKTDVVGFTFDHLGEGVYRAEIVDPMFDTWSADDISPGQAIVARPVGSCGVQLEVLDQASGAPVREYSISARLEGVNFSPDMYPLLKIGEEFPSDGVVWGLLPMRTTLIVTGENGRSAEVRVGTPEPGQIVRRVVRL